MLRNDGGEILTHGLECGVGVEVLGRLLVRAADLSRDRIWLRYHHRRLGHVIQVLAV